MSTSGTQAIKVVVEFTAKPGRREELRRVLEQIIAKHGAGTPGYQGSTRFEVLEHPDMLVELADWQSLETRNAHMRAAADSGVFAPLMDLMAAPFRVTVLRALA
ncbi:MAG TPA: antibiotic biosynthesis monooxygenase [Polyangiaceae bacterium]|jgi:quinol monooxygenase YgiN|nr:antibiotic biosynthesis monooxygenase [Polyangiaceae bacterium]